ncbi:MAG: polysaccharide biosynthesis/export family protein [Opitutaceae bacterium]|nr:polysaccharide biosynthesis/export family protein [Opitutaceae bacterium]
MTSQDASSRRGLWSTALLASMAFFVAACAGQGPRTSAGGVVAIQPSAQEYRLGSGDKLRVIVYGEQDLSGEFDVDSTGSVSLPLIGEVKAAEKTL